MRLLNGKQGLRRSQFAKELKGADLEKVLIVPIDTSKVLQKELLWRYCPSSFCLYGQSDWNEVPYPKDGGSEASMPG